MRKLALVLILLLALVSCGKKEPLTFVFTPGPGTDLAFTKEQYGKLVAEIGEELGYETEIIITTSAAATTEALRNGTADIARYGPFGYVLARDEAGVVPIVRENLTSGGEYYYGVIIGQPGLWEEPFDIGQIAGKTVAFAEPGSTSGYLFGVAMMAEAGMTLDDLGEYYFVGSHPAVIEAVVNGAAQVGFTNDRRLNIAVDEGAAVSGINFVYLAQSPPIMANPWAARPDLDIDMGKLRGAFLGASAEALAASDLESFVVALDYDYNFIRDMAKYQ